VEQTFQSIFGKEKLGRVRYYRKTMTSSTFKKKEKTVAIRKEHANEMSGMTKKNEDLEARIKFMVNNQI